MKQTIDKYFCDNKGCSVTSEDIGNDKNGMITVSELPGKHFCSLGCLRDYLDDIMDRAIEYDEAKRRPRDPNSMCGCAQSSMPPGTIITMGSSSQRTPTDVTVTSSQDYLFPKKYPLTEEDCVKIGGHCYEILSSVAYGNPEVTRYTRICKHCGKVQTGVEQDDVRWEDQ